MTPGKEEKSLAVTEGGNVGLKTPVGLARGLNALYTQGGLQYSPPFR